jgi:hypothetical protein
MRFTLTYVGDELKSTRKDDNRKKEKQILREGFHDQLKELWEASNLLAKIDRSKLPTPTLVNGTFDLPRPLPEHQEEKFASFLFRVPCHSAVFVPLITAPMEAECHLALRIGRPAKAGSIVYAGGDLDNRLKTLFDALSAPRSNDSVDASQLDQAEYFCLLSDDVLVTGLSIESYQLLGTARPEDYIDLNLTVTITARTPMYGTLGLLFGG